MFTCHFDQLWRYQLELASGDPGFGWDFFMVVDYSNTDVIAIVIIKVAVMPESLVIIIHCHQICCHLSIAVYWSLLLPCLLQVITWYSWHLAWLWIVFPCFSYSSGSFLKFIMLLNLNLLKYSLLNISLNIYEFKFIKWIKDARSI